MNYFGLEAHLHFSIYAPEKLGEITCPVTLVVHQTQALSFPVRAASSAPLPAFPPPGGSPRPFPRGLWEGRWAGPAVPEPQFLLREVAVLLGSSGVGAPPFLQPFAAFELASCLSRSVLIFGEGAVAVWGKSFRPSQGSPVCTVESTLVCSWVFFRSVVLHWTLRGGKMFFNKLVVQRRMAMIWEFGRRADLTVSVL